MINRKKKADNSDNPPYINVAISTGLYYYYLWVLALNNVEC